MFLSYENGKENYSIVFKRFVFCGYIAKICILQALVSILAIGLGNENFDFCSKIFQIFKKNQNFHFFLLLTAMCYGNDEDIKIYFLTSGKPKKQKTSQNNAYHILEMKVKND